MTTRSANNVQTERRRGRFEPPRSLVLLTLLGVVLAMAGLVGVLGLGPVPIPTDPEPEAERRVDIGAPDDEFLPFDRSALEKAKKRVFAHYFPPYPISFDNKPSDVDYYARNYLTPDGESGKHSAYGGLLRDRPLGRPPLAGDWQLADMRTDVDHAADAGLDGFFVDILSLSGDNWDRTITLYEAAGASGRSFTVTPQIDATASAGGASVPELAAKMARLLRMPSAYRLSTGEYVLSAFKAENKPVSYWSSLLETLRTQYGLPVVFMPVLLDANHLERYASISYAMSNWGSRNPTNTLTEDDFAGRAHAMGRKWIAPISVQDSRPNQSVYWEAANLAQLRASWERAMADGAEFALLNTWNDYSESTSFAPSVSHGWVFLDVNAYYLAQFKFGVSPPIVRDAVYVTHRVQPHGAEPLLGQDLQVLTNGDRDPARDMVEVQTFLTAPAQVTVSIGAAVHTYDSPAGTHWRSFPLVPGDVSATATRDGSIVAIAASPYAVASRLPVQDLQYYAAGSLRNVN